MIPRAFVTTPDTLSFVLRQSGVNSYFHSGQTLFLYRVSGVVSNHLVALCEAFE